MADIITVTFEFPDTEYEQEGLTHEQAVDQFIADLQGLAYDFGEGEQSRAALAGHFDITSSRRVGPLDLRPEPDLGEMPRNGMS